MYRIDVLGSKMRVKIFNYIDDNLKINWTETVAQ